jgi:hypothetical protein
VFPTNYQEGWNEEGKPDSMKISERVALVARLLDTFYPRWASHIDLQRFTNMDGDRCVGTQLGEAYGYNRYSHPYDRFAFRLLRRIGKQNREALGVTESQFENRQWEAIEGVAFSTWGYREWRSEIKTRQANNV